MSKEPAAGEGGNPDVPDAVLEWLNSVAAERDVSGTELFHSLFAETEPTGSDREGSAGRLDQLEGEFGAMVEDVRDRIVQVKRETDGKAPADHSHHELRGTLEQVEQEVATLEADIDGLAQQLDAGFENYEEILTYLTDTTDALDRKLGRLASAVLDLRERVSHAARDEARRTALVHLTDTANRNGIEKANCEDCGETVRIGMLIEPRCPHCDAPFSTLEPRSGFFRASVLHVGTLPALESAPEAVASESLEALVGSAGTGDGPARDTDHGDSDDGRIPPAAGEMVEAGADAPADRTAEATPTASSPADRESGGADPKSDGRGSLQAIDGVGPAYADRLVDAGIDDLVTLARADPAELGEAIDVPEPTVADWVAQAADGTGTP